jgi:hypothetical protein
MKTKNKRRIGYAAVLGVTAAIVGALIIDQKPASAQRGITVETEPKGATIWLDGKEQKEKSDTTIKAEPGRHTVKLQLEGYDAQEVQVEIREDVEEAYPLKHTFTVGGSTVLGPVKPGETPQTTYKAEQLETYRSEQHKYEIQIPKEWLVETDPQGLPHVYNKAAKEEAKNNPQGEREEAMFILVTENPKQLAPKEWYFAREEFAMEDQSQIKTRELTLNGLPAFQWETPYGWVPYVNTVVTRGDKAFLLQQKKDSPDRRIYEQLIQSFKFI